MMTREHPVITILNHDRETSNMWTGSLDEELTNQDAEDADGAQ
jgi:hypothetical protein